MNICKKCGSKFDSSFCPNCGTKAEDDIKVEFTKPHFKEEKKNNHVILKFLGLIIILMVLYNLVTPSSDSSSNNINPTQDAKTKTASTDSAAYLKESEIPYLYTNADKYKGKRVKLSGEVFTDPDKDTDRVYVQMFQDPTNSNNQTLLICPSGTDVKSGDYIIIDGKVKDMFEGKNLMGGTIQAPRIVVDNVKISTYQDVVAPAVKTIKPKQKEKQFDYEIIIQKVEFADSETRVYVTVNNNGNGNFSIMDAKLIQGKSQYEEQYNYDANYPEVQNDIHSGVSTSGIICFPSINHDKDFQLNLDTYSDNYDDDLKDFIFEVKNKSAEQNK